MNLNALPEGWIIKKLSEVCEKITDGTHQTPQYFNEGFVFLSSKNVTKGKIDWENIRYIDEKQHIEMQKRVSPKINDVLLAKNGTTGVAAIVDREITFDIYVSLALLRPLDCLFPKFLLHFINSSIAKKQFNSRLKGIGVPNLHLNEIREVEIPLPPLSEQTRIAARLDELNARIATARQNIQRLRDKLAHTRRSVLNAAFSDPEPHWEMKTLKEIALYFGRGKSKNRPRNDPKLYGGQYPFIQTGDISAADQIITSYSQTYNEVGLAQSKLWSKGTICITIAANIAETAILGFDACFPDSVIGVQVNPKLANEKYVEYLLRSYKAELQAKSKGIAQANINVGTFENFTFPFPPVEEQTEIVRRVEALLSGLSAAEARAAKVAGALEALPQALLRQAFSGRL